MRLRALGVAAVGLALVGLSTAPGSVQAHPRSYEFTPVISGLNEPRGLAFDGRGSLYVAQAGTPGAGAQGVTRTGAVSKFRWHDGRLTASWSTPFNSLYSPGPGGGVEVLGPAAVSATGQGCRHDHARHGEGGCGVLALLSESRRGVQADTGVAVSQIGHLYRLNGRTGTPTDVSDVGDQNYQWTADHKSLFPDDFPDSNPYAVLVTGHGHHTRTYVADAGANTISRVRSNGTLQVISYIPNETSGAKRDATPTCIAEGPDGALYVGTLNLLSNLQSPGQSSVWRVDPKSSDWRHNARLWATGFTTIDGCTFDHRGNFWASELFYDNGSGRPPGDLAKLRFSRHPAATAISHVGGGQVPLPGGIAEGPDGALYVSSGVADTRPGSGAVIRVSRDDG